MKLYFTETPTKNLDAPTIEFALQLFLSFHNETIKSTIMSSLFVLVPRETIFLWRFCIVRLNGKRQIKRGLVGMVVSHEYNFNSKFIYVRVCVLY